MCLPLDVYHSEIEPLDQPEDMGVWYDQQAALAKDHPPTSECPDAECAVCAIRDCPHQAAEHYWADGCPACTGPPQ